MGLFFHFKEFVYWKCFKLQWQDQSIKTHSGKEYRGTLTIVPYTPRPAQLWKQLFHGCGLYMTISTNLFRVSVQGLLHLCTQASLIKLEINWWHITGKEWRFKGFLGPLCPPISTNFNLSWNRKGIFCTLLYWTANGTCNASTTLQFSNFQSTCHVTKPNRGLRRSCSRCLIVWHFVDFEMLNYQNIKL